MNNPVFERLHPLTVVVELPRVIRQLFLAIVVVAVNLMSGQMSEEIGIEAGLAILGLLVIVPAAVRYYSFGYAIHDGKLLVRSGLLRKTMRTIPLDRIQNINIKRPILHRVLGLVDLEIETAAGAQAEAIISALSEEAAHVLKARLLGNEATNFSRLQRPDDRVVIYKPTNMELLLVGASENRAGAMIAAVAGLGFLQPMIEKFVDSAGEQAVRSLRSANFDGGRLFLIGFGLFLIVGWLISIASAFVKYYNFELSEMKGKLRRSYGLINHFENTLPIKRIQTVHIDQNFVQKWLKICKMSVATAGGMTEGSSSNGQDGQPQVMTTPLLTPVLRDEMRSHLLEITLPKSDLRSLEYKGVPKATILRHLRSGYLSSLGIALAFLAMITLFATIKPEMLARFTEFQYRMTPAAVFVVLMLMTLLSGVIYYRTTRWSRSNGVIAVTTGWLKTRWNYLPVTKVQLSEVTQSPIQRWLGLATARFYSAAMAYKHTEIDDLSFEDAVAVGLATHQESGRTRDALFDGF